MLVRLDGQILDGRLVWREGLRGNLRPRLVAGGRLVDPPGEKIELLDADLEIRDDLASEGYCLSGGDR
jgi:hypothetical protein